MSCGNSCKCKARTFETLSVVSTDSLVTLEFPLDSFTDQKVFNFVLTERIADEAKGGTIILSDGTTTIRLLDWKGNRVIANQLKACITYTINVGVLDNDTVVGTNFTKQIPVLCDCAKGLPVSAV